MVVGEFTQETDLVIIGGGPGGYSAAFRAAELGQSVVIVDTRDALGGVCLHEGCVPSKTLLHIADIINTGLDAGKFGIEFGTPSINHDQVRSWTNKTIDTLASGLESLGKKHNIDCIQGRAYFEDSRILHILDGSIPRVRFRRAIIATGSQPISHPGLPFDGTLVLSPDQAATLPSVPGKLLIIGSDYMAVEMANIYATLGSRVWLVAEDDRLLPEADKDVVRPLQKSLADKLEGLHLNCSSDNAEADKNTVTFRFEGKDVPEQKTSDFYHQVRSTADSLRLGSRIPQSAQACTQHINQLHNILESAFDLTIAMRTLHGHTHIQITRGPSWLRQEVTEVIS